MIIGVIYRYFEAIDERKSLDSKCPARIKSHKASGKRRGIFS